VLGRLLVTVAAVVGVGGFSWWWQRRDRRRRSPVHAPDRTGWPRQLHRGDFDDGSRPWLVVLFSSRTCGSCDRVRAAVQGLAAPDTRVVEVAYQDAPDLHRRYEVPGVPLVLVAGPDGVVEAGFLGPVTEAELSEALGRARLASPDPSR